MLPAYNEEQQEARLVRMKRMATGLLVAMAVVFLFAHYYRDDLTWLYYVRAFAEAAMVGALADWFAVTALFRHPLGIPIPHTAIIQNERMRSARRWRALLKKISLLLKCSNRVSRQSIFHNALACGWQKKRMPSG